MKYDLRRMTGEILMVDVSADTIKLYFRLLMDIGGIERCKIDSAYNIEFKNERGVYVDARNPYDFLTNYREIEQ